MITHRSWRWTCVSYGFPYFHQHGRPKAFGCAWEGMSQENTHWHETLSNCRTASLVANRARVQHAHDVYNHNEVRTVFYDSNAMKTFPSFSCRKTYFAGLVKRILLTICRNNRMRPGIQNHLWRIRNKNIKQLHTVGKTIYPDVDEKRQRRTKVGVWPFDDSCPGKRKLDIVLFKPTHTFNVRKWILSWACTHRPVLENEEYGTDDNAMLTWAKKIFGKIVNCWIHSHRQVHRQKGTAE